MDDITDGRASFKFFRSYYEAAKLLTDEAAQGAFLMALAGYALDGIEPDISGPSGAMFLLARPNLDASNRKAEAGKIGGTNKQTASKPQANDKQNASKPQANRKQSRSDKGIRNKEEGDRSKEVGDTPHTPQGKEQVREQDFDKFWALYPKKKSKGQARTAWNKLNPSADTVRAIMEKLPLLIASGDWQKNGGQYIPYPATWLNAEGWNDEIAAAPAASALDNGYQYCASDLAAIAKLKKLRDELAADD